MRMGNGWVVDGADAADASLTNEGPAITLTDGYGTRRVSDLMPGYFCVAADLHNHTRLSDGRGDPREAFASMRRAGQDVAALTDHANLASSVGRPGRVPLAGRFGGAAPPGGTPPAGPPPP